MEQLYKEVPLPGGEENRSLGGGVGKNTQVHLEATGKSQVGGNPESHQLRHKRWETRVPETRDYPDSGRYRPGRGFSGRVLPLEGGAPVPAIKSRGLQPQESVTI